MKIYRLTVYKNKEYIESFLIDGWNKNEAVDKGVKLLIDNGIIIPNSFDITVEEVRFNGRDYVNVESEENVNDK